MLHPATPAPITTTRASVRGSARTRAVVPPNWSYQKSWTGTVSVRCRAEQPGSSPPAKGLDHCDLRVDTDQHATQWCEGETGEGRQAPRRGSGSEMGEVPSVEDVLGRVAMFSGQEITYTTLEGGLSHQIWVVRCGAT